MSTIKKCDASIILDTSPDRPMYCVYEHYASFEMGKPPELIFVGASKITTLLHFQEARKNTEWARMLGYGGQVMVRIIATGEDLRECQRYAIQHLNQLPRYPRCNMRGTERRGVARAIQCSNGQVFQSQKEAARVMGVTESALSRHLNNLQQNVGGLRFHYIDPKKVPGQ